ncbi:group I truncated hemoglobin [Sphingomonas radiodurans]|uniref:group I truncated hemoglobin n=1 Tax=Sphingomonas radiodurans TaxID=2890321 RepID=UPI001E3E344B|nr:group 1 truncated hemoglobin [Sphingomonas radiodurans]WBH15749.1 group 1 truncated hemoglobin [Sphingomonas radiodurans]
MFLAALALLLAPQGTPVAAHAMPGEGAVDPYQVDAANAGARPFEGDAMARAFNGQEGIRRIVDDFVARNFADPRVGEIFMNQDKIRFKRTLFEQFCYILNAGCSYTGRDMRAAHKDMGVQQADMNRVVENLQAAMQAEGVPFAAQNRFLAKLAPMRRDVVGR